MNTYAFFMAYFGRFLSKPTGDDVADAERILNISFTNRVGKPQRLAAGWAVISPHGSRLQLDIPAVGVESGASGTRFEAFAGALQQALPVMLLAFDKKPLGVNQLFITHDLRAVRICDPKTSELFDLAAEPQGMHHRNIRKAMQ
jgi:hypothetical protein